MSAPVGCFARARERKKEVVRAWLCRGEVMSMAKVSVSFWLVPTSTGTLWNLPAAYLCIPTIHHRSNQHAVCHRVCEPSRACGACGACGVSCAVCHRTLRA